jgi:licD1 protein
MPDKYLTLKEIQNLEFYILKEFAKFCEEHKLFYMLTYGTLLGAKRHNGFIPWDDDIDVMMPRDDYEKFVLLVKRLNNLDRIELLDSSQNEYFYPFAKLCLKNTVAEQEDSKAIHGVWLDIFPIDKVPADRIKRILFHKKLIFCRALIISYNTDFKTMKNDWKWFVKYVLAIISGLIGCKRITRYAEREAKKYNNTDSNLYSAVVWQISSKGNISEKNLKIKIKEKFENELFNIPLGYDEYLKELYGDYMQLPPIDKRKNHYLKVYYKKNEVSGYTKF